MGGDVNGAYYERLLRQGSTSFYVIIRPRRFMTERYSELVDKGQFTMEELHPEVTRLGRRPQPGTLWTYELESFEVDREHHENSESFNDHARDYESQVFDDFESLMKYCEDRFQISERDFKKSWQTNYPQS
jgi:hypothetical protein